jgi:oligoendopeptidase F
MTMELLTLDSYQTFYPEKKALARAQKSQLLRCITILPWVATVDAFQEWVYDHPGHSSEARNQAWKELYYRFHGQEINWEGYEEQLAFLWQKQSHIFGMPFYYIEYAIAQLGALAVWKNYKQDPEKGLEGYLNALKMGYTRPIPEVYEAAGIRFDFSEDYIRDIVEFCLAEYKAIEL